MEIPPSTRRPQRSTSPGSSTPCRHAVPAGPSAVRASLADDHPIATLLDEHQAILAKLARLVELVGRTDVPERGGLEELAALAVHLIGVEPHHRREEQVLFPALEERGIHGPPEMMAFEHVRLRAMKHALRDLAELLLEGDRGLWPEARATAETLAQLLRAHIAKEDDILYPLALRVIRDPAVWAELRRRCDAIGYCCTHPGRSLVHDHP